MTVLGHIAEIWRYPVSSVGGERLDQANLVEGGIEGDRLWGIAARHDGEIAAPEKRRRWRPLPNLLARAGDHAPEIAGPDGKWLKVSSEEAEKLVSGFLGFPVILLPHTPYGSESSGGLAPRYQRADIHLLTTASMRKLATLLPDPAQVDTRRFRPNIVVETLPEHEGFVEEQLIGRRIALGSALISVTEPCARCTFTALAQGGLAFEPAVLHNVARHGKGGFGAQCSVERPAKIQVGDPVELISV